MFFIVEMSEKKMLDAPTQSKRASLEGAVHKCRARKIRQKFARARSSWRVKYLGGILWVAFCRENA